MNDLKNRSNDNQLFDVFEKKTISFSLSDIKKALPRVNFKKIKLNKLQDFENFFKQKNITEISLNDSLLKLALPVRKTASGTNYEAGSVNPLRKKQDQEEERIQKLEVKSQTSDVQATTPDLNVISSQEEKAELQSEIETSKEPRKDITFNLEAQVLQEQENVIFSPAIVSMPPYEEDVVSVSETVFVWPPERQKKIRKRVSIKTSQLKKKQKGKAKHRKKQTYFLSEPKEVKTERASEEKAKTTFPWATSEQDYQAFESIFQGGLEQELLDLPFEKLQEPQVFQKEEKDKELEVIKTEVPVDKEIVAKKYNDKDIEVFYKKSPFEKPQEQPFQEQISSSRILKALGPDIPTDLISSVFGNVESKDIKLNTVFKESNKINYDIEFQGKVKKMFQKYGFYLTPIRIIILGGFAATLGYLLWTSLPPNVQVIPLAERKKDKVVVRDIFKQKHGYKKDIVLDKDRTKGKSVVEEVTSEEEKVFKPITEEQRLALIQKARESLESRLDPFGQEAVLPPRMTEEKAKEKEEKPPDISLQRKQVELVGVISTPEKNLALVNVYTADYTVNIQDDKIALETKLKTALSMAVPNRIEISLLDPIEDWYVRQITKGKGRTEDPTIELVRGDKKFKLRVGQRVLLPEEKTFEQIKEELEAQKALQGNEANNKEEKEDGQEVSEK